MTERGAGQGRSGLVAITHYRPWLYLSAVVTALAMINALALWGVDVAERGEAVLRSATGLGVVICGIVVGWQMSGKARWWRLLYAAATALWLLGQVLWWTDSAGTGDVVAVAPAAVVYLLLPAFALTAVVLLVRSGGSVIGPGGLLRTPPVTSLLDGVVAGVAFLILVALGGFGTGSGGSLPRTGQPGVELAFALAELVVVAAVVVVAMVYDPDRPYRTNYLLLAGGLVMMASSDRLIAYVRSVDSEGGRFWAGLGLIVGPLTIALAMLEQKPRTAEDGRPNWEFDWARLVLPFVGFLGVAMLFAYHVVSGRSLSPLVACVTVPMVSLVALRQVIAMRAQRLLTERLYRAQSGLAYQVHHDALTGLPNRLLFALRLDEAMVHGNFVLVFVDLDDFKEVNDRFGHAAGDELLRAVGERLRHYVGEKDTLARIGGDEFAILIEGESEQLDAVADRLQRALRNPFPVQGSSVRVRASMGLVRPDAYGGPQTSDDLLRQADISMYAGKRLGKDTAVVYQPLTGVRADFPTALRNAQGGVPAGFHLVYQPVVQLPEGKLVAVEALARWNAPNGMHVSPDTFVVASEAAGMGAVLDGMVLELACTEVAAAGLDVDIHVNVGAPRLGNADFERRVQRTLQRHAIEPSRLVLEITETVPIVDLADAAAQIARLNALGVRVALDDFGAGYNSLTSLHALPVQIVKLHRTLASFADPVRDLALYRSVIDLCAELGFVVIAEGIESRAQVDTVQAAGCHFAQGHLFGRPTSITELSHYRAPELAGGSN
ncbi:putative bifunctional diguanylate cyclase/phosphodiesterase [Mycolicibacterium mengxianglii]|uniref:putative bifunctional diguanylate cyclase/phosphodiesterase n=1 Tax=Mycolicibacterium mengxianglii TaxID=2736649 RepID=UPI0018D0D6C8